jgi:diguanylate cyclase (GGDEF)-like protein/PAS domain S-box-containing protein
MTPDPATPPDAATSNAVASTREPLREVERLAFVLRSSRLGLWDWDMTTGEVFVDEAWAAMLGRDLAEVTPATFASVVELCHPDDRERITAAIERHVAGTDEFYDEDIRLRHRDGRWVWIRTRGQVVQRAQDGTPLRMTGTHEDVSERHAREVAFGANQQLLESAQRIAHVGSWYLDVDTQEVTWTAELYRMLGFDATKPPPPGDTHGELFAQESWDRLRTAIGRTQRDGVGYELELEMEREGRHLGWMLARGEAIRDRVGRIVGVQGVALDITDRKHNEQQLARLASRDPLTGLANRTALLEYLERWRQQHAPVAGEAHAREERRRSLACLLVDLDNFKYVNDSLGHEVGDLLLVAAADRLRQVARSSDVTARLGGDEFVVVLAELDSPRTAVAVAERLVEAFRAPFHVAGNELFLTASVGIALAEDGAAAADLLRDADTAMYSAKESGRDQLIVFNRELRERVDERVLVERQLRHALDQGELETWFQPEVDLRTGRVLAGEALLRWRRRDGTVESAASFIRISEETGLIRRIGEQVLLEACQEGARWQQHGRVEVRVNVSGVQLAEPNLIRHLDRALEVSGLDPSLLCLELTETVLLRESSIVRDNMREIDARDVRIAIDDFGTGFASLSYLHRYDVDVIKIDRSFIERTTEDEQSAKLVRGIVRLARTMDIDVIAEGVETAAQAARLLALGCNRAQGYLFAPAVPAPEFLSCLAQGFEPVAITMTSSGTYGPA